MSKIAGIDFSITSPAICIGEEGDIPVFHAFRSAKKMVSGSPNIILYDYPDWVKPQERFEYLSNWAMEIIKDVDIVKIEGFSMGSKGRVFDIAEATGILKWKIWKAGKELIIIPPTTAKLFATGKGNATKNKMVLSYLEEENAIDVFGILDKKFNQDKKDVASPMGDIIDSYWMWRYHE